ncbi:iron-containing alcohol dehydrogenase [Pseudoalteromonas sp. Isolate3]|uniref:iron-containing alcohol dehydrogenase n=1 Tax=Pseudoalteromonas sp. Isolate3 TaxID=2908526 RepID=UPI001EFED08A|nr:iron-containing alcohol dehydrogenase [Pseudoalteromonas sp. Isolate3]MCG9709078.1 iron-containing alcohol dehydrogenase [Pseudoalteromonas sp. Isolate3]
MTQKMNQEINYHELGAMLCEHLNILLISGKSLEKTQIKQKLSLDSPQFHRFSEFSENPTIQEVILAKTHLEKVNATAIVAIGGGTAIDIAKLTKYYKGNDLSTDETTPPIVDNISSIPIFVIPTTFGSGSESTSFAVMYIQEKKFSITHPDLLPNFYLLDPDLSRSLPLYTKASACLDALCQAIESYWANSATLESRQDAIFAIIHIAKYFEDFITAPTSRVETIIAEASNRAGKAINVTKTTAPHALSYFISQQYNISHGHAVALCMLNMFKINEEKAYQLADYNLIKTLREIYSALGVSCAIEARMIYKYFLMKAHLTSSFSELGLSSIDKVKQVINSVNLDRLKNHPIELKPNDLKHIFIDE